MYMREYECTYPGKITTRLRGLYLDGARLIPIGKRVHKEGGLRVRGIPTLSDQVELSFSASQSLGARKS